MRMKAALTREEIIFSFAKHAIPLLWLTASICHCQDDVLISSISAYSDLSRFASPASCQDGISLPNQQAFLLDTREKQEAFAGTVREYSNLVTKMIDNTEVFEMSRYPSEDLQAVLGSIVGLFGPEDSGQWIDSTMTSQKDLSMLKMLISQYPNAIPLFKKVQINAALGMMTEPELEPLCMSLSQGQMLSTILTAFIINNYPHCVVFLRRHARSLEQNATLPLVMSPKSGLIYQRLRTSDVPWSFFDLLIDPSQVTPDDISKLPASQIQQEYSLSVLQQIFLYLRPETREMIAEVLAASGPEFSEETLDMAGHYLMFLPLAKLKQYMTDELIERFLENNNTIHENVIWLMVPTLYEKRETPNFYKRFSLVMFFHTYTSINMLDEFEAQTLLDALIKGTHYVQSIMSDQSSVVYMSVGSTPFSGNSIQSTIVNINELQKVQMGQMVQIRPFLERLFSDGSVQLSVDDMVALSTFLPLAPNHVFENAEADKVYKAWPKLMPAASLYSLIKLRIVYDKLQDKFPTPQNTKASDLLTLGPLLLVMPCESINEIPVTSLREMISMGGFTQGMSLRCEENEEICWILVSKIVQGAEAEVVSDLGPLGKYVKLEDLGDGVYTNDYFKPLVREEMLKRAEKQPKIEDRGGDNTAAIALPNFGGTTGLMAHMTEIENSMSRLPMNGLGLDLLINIHLATRVTAIGLGHSPKHGMLDADYQFLRRIYSLRSDMENVCVPKTIAENLVCFFTRASYADLSKLSKDSLMYVLWAEGRALDCVNTMLPQQLRRHFELLISEDTALSRVDTWTPDMILSRGPALLCGMTADHVGRLSPQTAFQFGQQLCQCSQLDTETRKLIFNKIMENFDGNLDAVFQSPYNVKSLSSCLVYATQVQILDMSTPSKKLLAAMTSIILDAMAGRLMMMKKDSSRMSDLWLEQAAIKGFVTALQAVMAELGMSSLEIVSQFTQFKQYLHPVIISAMTDEEFRSSVEFLRDNDQWEDGLLDTLNAKIMEVYGDVANWKSLDFLTMKKLLTVVFDSEEDLKKAGLDDCTFKSVAAYLVSNEVFTDSLCSEITTNNFGELSLQNPELLCCLSGQEIQDLDAQVIVDVVMNIEGECPPCLLQHEKNMMILATKFKSYIMEKRTVESEVDDVSYSQMKCLAGKLTKDDLQDLPSDSLAGLDTQAIMEMDAEVFCEIATPEILELLNVEQRLSLDDEKLQCLDAEQFKAVLRNMEMSEEDMKEPNTDIDLENTEIGETPDFKSLQTDLAKPLTQPGKGGQKGCVPASGRRAKGITDASQLQALKDQLDEKQLQILNKITSLEDIDLSTSTNLDLLRVLDELLTMEEGRVNVILSFLEDLPNLLQDTSQETSQFIYSTLAEVYPHFYLLFKSQIMCSSFRKLHKRELMALCMRLSNEDVSTQTYITFSLRCPVCVSFMAMDDNNEASMTLDKEKGTSFYTLLLQTSRELNLHHLLLAPGSLTPDVIAAIPDQQFSDISMLGELADPEFLMMAPRHILRLLFQRVIRSFGPMDQWNRLLLSRLRNYIFLLTRSELRDSLQPAALIEMLTSRDGKIQELLLDYGVAKFVGQMINKYIMEMAEVIPTDILHMPQVFCLQLSAGLPRFLLKSSESLYDREFLLEMAVTCHEFYEIPQHATRKFIQHLLSGSATDEDALHSMRKVIGLMSGRDIRRFSKDAWIDTLDSIDMSMLNKGQILNIWNIIKEDYPATSLTCEKIRSLGHLVKAWTTTYIDQIPETVITECLPDISATVTKDEAKDLPKPLSRGLWKKIKSNVTGSSNTIEDYVVSEQFDPKMVNIIPRQEMESLNVGKNSETVKHKIARLAQYAKGSHLAKLVKHIIDVSNLEDQQILMKQGKMAEVLLTYGSDSDIDQLQDGDAMGQMLEQLAKEASNMNAKSLEEIFKLLTMRVGLQDDCSNETLCMEKSQARAYGGLFIAARPSKLFCLTKMTRRAVLESIGSDWALCSSLTRAMLQDLLSMAREIETSDAKSGDLANYGCLLCGHTEDQVKQLSDQQLDNLHPSLATCPQLDSGTAVAIVDRLIKIYDGFPNYLEQNPDLSIGPLIKHVTPAEIDKLPMELKEMVLANLGTVARMMTKEKEDRHIRMVRGEIPEAEEEVMKRRENDVLSAMYTASLEVQTSGPRRRRKRSEDEEEKCVLLQEFDGNLCFMTMEQINELSDQTVRDCAVEFQQCAYSQEILTRIAIKAETAMSETADQWDITDYEELGKLLGLMSEETVGQMTLTDDVMAVLPLNEIMPNSDLLMKQYLLHTDVKIEQLAPEQVADYSLMMGHLTKEELNNLDPNVVADAALMYEMGEMPLHQLEFEKAQLYTNKIVESGKIDFSNATVSDIENLGPLAGALPENMLKGLSSEQKQGLTADAMSIIPGPVLSKAFSVDDLEMLTRAQVNAISEEQKSHLSKEKKQAISAKATVAITEDDGSGSSSLQISCILLVLTICLSACSGRVG